ncbi:hypothetical protein LTR36_004288 [Oleoguttula mirabilis]|uniref:Uncharacterized protein n=1 Tax=Oleoguttula mirabilis TaxID=1507867 RepID=A0AAV9JHQ4_9PEZI|nr:hypothetical protein LTR36_004288 [Oleoguttula mirabilis]
MVLCPRSEPVDIQQSTCCEQCFATVFRGLLGAICQPCRMVTAERMGQELVGMLERAAVGESEGDAENIDAQADVPGDPAEPEGGKTTEDAYRDAGASCKEAEKAFERAEEACKKAEARINDAAAAYQKAESSCKTATASFEAAEATFKRAADAADMKPIYHWPDR